MRPIPIPDGVAEAMGGERVVIGEPGDPTRTDVRPCEYVVAPSTLYPGRPTVTALIELDDDDRAAIAAGARLSLTLDGGELPWSLAVEPAPEPDPIVPPECDRCRVPMVHQVMGALWECECGAMAEADAEADPDA